MRDLTYVLPIKTATPAGINDELTAYLIWLSARLPVIVVDGSSPEVYAANHQAWGPHASHIAPSVMTPNGKVGGVITGVGAAATPGVVVADDDVRYDDAALARVSRLLASHDAVMPQNYFDPTPWHAAWDTGRILVNRSLGGDYAGTIALRREAFESTRGYCGAVLFENLELMRTLDAHGYDVHRPMDLFVARRPPGLRQFAGQRLRQAYDSRAQPARLTLELSLLPMLLLLPRRGLAALAGATVVLAEFGRRRGGGTRVWAAGAALWAVPWALERSATAWLALLAGLRGGAAYHGRRLKVAAHSSRSLAEEGCPQARCGCGRGAGPEDRAAV